jgi:hypothetical protein
MDFCPPIAVEEEFGGNDPDEIAETASHGVNILLNNDFVLRFIREIKPCKLSKEFFCCLVIRLRGVSFIVKIAQMHTFTFVADLGTIFFVIFSEINAFVF